MSNSEIFQRDFSDLVNAGFPYVYISSYEEERVLQQIRRASETDGLIKVKRRIFVWAQSTGFVSDDSMINGTSDPHKAISYIEKCDENAIFILKDFHVFFGSERGTHMDFNLVRMLRDILVHLKVNRKTVVFLSPRLVIPEDMEKEISILDFPLPSEDEIEEVLNELICGLDTQAVHLTSDEKKQLVSAALGLTIQEAENAFCRAIVRNKGLDSKALQIVHEEKNQAVKKTGVLEFVNTDLVLDDIGGLENLKKWLLRRNNAWSEQAKRYHLPAPKGVLITGVPGCGKSLTAKAMSAIWGLPLIKLDMGKIFGGLVGSSEENMRKAIATAEAVAPCVLWVDEIEKGFTGLKSGGDSGTSARVFGTFLTWMQEKTAPVFVIATANDISALPPELLRKGRFDEIFFTDLPTRSERAKIFDLHIRKRTENSEIAHNIQITPECCYELADLTKGYVGAEIEQIVIAAMYEAFYNGRGLEKEDLIKCIRETVPLSATQKEQILSLREWATERAVLATAPEDREQSANNDNNSDFRERQGGRIVDFK